MDIESKTIEKIISEIEKFYNEEESFVKMYPESKCWKESRMEAIWECRNKIINVFKKEKVVE